MDSHEECPICSTLPISSTPIGSEATSVVFSLAQHEEKLDAIRQWSRSRWSASTTPLGRDERSQEGNHRSCDLCRLITDLDRHWLGLETTAPHKISPSYSSTCSPNTLKICVDEGKHTCHAYTFQLESCANLTPDLWPMVPGQLSRVIHPDPISPRVFARLLRWIELCDSSHPECKGVVNSTLPTRVLDVGSGKGLDPIVLLETNGVRGRYIALSHCV